MNSPDISHLTQTLVLSDEDLMLRYCDGDFAAFKELYQRHSKPLYRFIAWRSPRAEWVDEVMQESWAALHKARASYQVSASFKTFLYQIAKHRLIDLMRQHQLLLSSDLQDFTEEDWQQDLDAMQTQAQHHGETAFSSGEQATPEQALIAKQNAAALQRAIHQLPGVQREALVLQQFNDMSLEEIASVSDVPVETIKSRLRYAMQKLRQHFVKHEQTQEELV
ncbi:sigma-70 family RNA polymerase sigma factor [Undibacterium cyanobacteriorum]|uniref:Sigma-70 family RNA polymerase sigma factor n=1 Tax=Undibacterium cyanobacteriorum TaxID=3073561 RepID=A0ABY9RL46_9BURK|nr:sigma-70 family RNA polymerase sigma factor [Undibacterium sp. 20NA77.5]WMW81583.1 sigma-70 family RNA polymerase sigma factor [Undibacterium sp. 20NA77.5]